MIASVVLLGAAVAALMIASAEMRRRAASGRLLSLAASSSVVGAEPFDTDTEVIGMSSGAPMRTAVVRDERVRWAAVSDRRASRWLDRVRGPRRSVELQKLIDDLHVVARHLRAGASFTEALRRSANEGATTVAPLADAVRLGVVPVGEAIAGWAGDQLPSTKAVLRAGLALAADGGRGAAAAVERSAATLHEQRAAAAEASAQAAQARLSAIVLGVVGPAFCAWSAASDERVRGVLLHTPVGWVCLLIGAVLQVAGALWMARLVRTAT